MSIVDKFNTAVQLWIDLTETDKNVRSLSISGYEVRSINDMLKKSITLDESLVTTFMLLQHFSKSYFDQRVVSVADISADPESVLAYVQKVSEFNAIVKSQEVQDVAEQFTKTLRAAVMHYGVDAEKIDEVLSKPAAIGFLRWDAFKSMEKLRVDQFLAGDVEPEGYRPLYNPALYQYWNINSLIEHACSMPSGVSMNLVRDPDELHSYFCFSIRNGGNVIVLSDVPQHAHPMARSMMRRPDTAMLARANQNWFPYDRLNIKHSFDEDGDYLGTFHDKYRESVETGMVPHHANFFRYAELVDLRAEQVMWAVMMFDLIKDRYWNRPIEHRALSYTGEMIRLDDQHRVIGAAAGTNLPVVGYQPLNLQPLTTADMTSDAFGGAGLSDFYAKWQGINRWMEDRYGDRVSENLFNMIDMDVERIKFLTSENVDEKHLTHAGKGLVVHDGLNRLSKSEYDSFTWWNRSASNKSLRIYQMHAVDPTSFGTREKIDADRKFIARHNFAKAIQREADAEFHAREEEIKAWFRKRVRANISALEKLAQEDKVMKPITALGGENTEKDYVFQFAGIRDLKSRDAYGFGSGMFATCTISGVDHEEFPRADPTCYYDDVKPSYTLEVSPRSLGDLMLLTGCTREELPDVLQNWCLETRHAGNHILDRIDPMEWALHNPWTKINFHTRLYLSKRALKRIRKMQA